MSELSDYRMVGVNNPGKQGSLNFWNEFLARLETIFNTAPRAVSSLAGLKAANITTGLPIWFDGSFWLVTDYASVSALVTADVVGAIYVRSSYDDTKALVRSFDGFQQPEWHGAKGDGATNDQAAFDNITSLAAALGYCHVKLRPGTIYRAGKQTPGKSGYYLGPENILKANALSSCIIRGNGATIKFIDGLKFGNFNPATGAVVDPAMPYTNVATAAAIGYGINCVGTAIVQLENLTIDGNSAGQVIGGRWGDSGRQTRHIGLQITDSLQVTCNNLHVFNFLLDCADVTNTTITQESDAPRPYQFNNCKFHDAGRNVVSGTSGNLVEFNNCSFINGGNAPIAGGSFVSSSPKTCFDVEAEAGALNRRYRFNDCVFLQGPNGATAFIADSGDSEGVTFKDCLFVGALWLNKPRFRLRGCKIFGQFTKLYNSADLDKTPLLEDCFITDATLGDTPLQTSGGVLVNGSTPTGVVLRKCQIDVSRLRPNIGGGFFTYDTTVTIRVGTADFVSGGNIISFGASAEHRNLRIIDAIVANIPGTPYILNTGSSKLYNCYLDSPGANVRWASSGASGFTGYFDNSNLGNTRGVDVLIDAAATLVARRDPNFQVLDVPLTAARTLTLSSTAVVDGDQFIIRRTPNSTGAFPLNVGTGPLIALATGGWAVVTYNAIAGAWQLTQAGTA